MFEKINFPRARKGAARQTTPTTAATATPTTPTSPDSGVTAGSLQSGEPSPDQMRALSRGRINTIFIASGIYLVSIIFLIIVEIGNTYDRRGINSLYFYKLDLKDIIPIEVENSRLVNSIARSMGLHDFYQVGLWNFCEGYADEGIVFCSTPEKFYWFNPVEVITNELLPGAKIALPATVNDILTLIRIASQCMWGFFMTGLVLNFVLAVAGPLAVYSRWWSLPFGLLSGISALLIVGGSGVATAMSVIFRWALTQQNELNIHAYVGARMLGIMWTASLLTIIAFLVHSGLCCFCASRRDVRTGRSSLFMSRHSPHLRIHRGGHSKSSATISNPVDPEKN